jgi:hypothetical protein
MDKHRLIQTLIAAVLCGALACRISSITIIFPTPITDSLIFTPTTQTITPHPNIAFPSTIPTPFATAWLQSPPKTISDVKSTNSDGVVLMQDALASVNLEIQLIEANSSKPIKNVKVHYVSNGNEYLAIAIDPNSKFLPEVKTGPISSLSVKISDSNLGALGGLIAGAPIYQGPELATLVLVLKLVEGLEIINSVKDLAELISDQPSLEKWTVGYADYCWTGEQMANAAGVISQAGSTVLPGSGPYVDAFVAMSLHVATQDAQVTLEKVPGLHKIRINYLIAPFGILPIEYLGPCESNSPTETPTLLPASTPTSNQSAIPLDERITWAAPEELSLMICDLPCLLDMMHQFNASPEAIAIVKYLNDGTYVSQFTEMGMVDMIVLVKAGCGHTACADFAFINDELGIVRGNEYFYASNFEQTIEYQELLKKYPNMHYWYDYEFEGEAELSDGGQRFIYKFYLRDPGYRIVELRIAYDFDVNGNFVGSSMISASEIPQN